MASKKKYKVQSLFPGLIDLLGAVIRQAVLDYKSVSKNKLARYWRDDAQVFLFKPGRLENFLEHFGMEDMINAEYVRRLAKVGKVRSDREYRYSAHDLK